MYCRITGSCRIFVARSSARSGCRPPRAHARAQKRGRHQITAVGFRGRSGYSPARRTLVTRHCTNSARAPLIRSRGIRAPRAASDRCMKTRSQQRFRCYRDRRSAVPELTPRFAQRDSQPIFAESMLSIPNKMASIKAR